MQTIVMSIFLIVVSLVAIVWAVVDSHRHEREQ